MIYHVAGGEAATLAQLARKSETQKV